MILDTCLRCSKLGMLRLMSMLVMLLKCCSITNILIDLNIPSLEHRRQVSSITLLYKIVHNLIDISLVDLIPVTSNTRGQDQRFHHIYARTNQCSNLFFPRSIRLWNSLPPDLIQQQSLQIFKYQMKFLLLSPTNQ